MYSPLGTQEECPCHYLFTILLMPLSTNFMQEADGHWLSAGIFLFYRFSFFISSWLQYTKSGFHEVRMERGLGQQTLPAQKCHQNISDMINVDMLIYFFFSRSKTKLIITQSILTDKQTNRETHRQIYIFS